MKDRSREQEPLGPIDVTAGPRKGGGEGGGEEVDTPSNDHVVVVRDQHSVEQVGKPHALEEGDAAEEKMSNLMFRNISILLRESVSCSHGRVLAHGALYKDAGDADDKPVHEVWDEEDKKTKSSIYKKTR